MRLILLENDGSLHAVRLDAVERILAPGEPAPEGMRQADLSTLLGFPADGVAGREVHRVVLGEHRVALAAGRPLATVSLPPERILPLPGYMFAVRRPPFRGAFESAALLERIARPAGSVPARVGLVLQEDAVLEKQGNGKDPGSAPLRASPRPAGPAGGTERRMPHLLVLSSGGTDVGVPLSAARQVLASQSVTPVGRARSHVAGLIVHDGKAIPVYHLARLLPGAPPSAPVRGRIVVLEEEGALAGFLVDDVHALRQADEMPSLVVQGYDLMRAAGAETSRGGVMQAARAAEGE